MADIYAVLTGDLVKSTAIGRESVEAVFDALAMAGEEVSRWPGEAGGPAFERFRGDGWQALVKRPEHALRAALLYSAAASAVGKGCATRIAIGFGPAGDLDPSSLGASDGAAFRASGRLLETMTRRERLAADGTRAFSGSLTPWLEAGFLFAGTLAARWTAKQALVMSHMLRQPAPTQSEVGAALSITQQSVQGHFEGAEGPALVSALERIEDT